MSNSVLSMQALPISSAAISGEGREMPRRLKSTP